MFISGAVNRYIEEILGGHGDFLRKIFNNQTNWNSSCSTSRHCASSSGTFYEADLVVLRSMNCSFSH